MDTHNATKAATHIVASLMYLAGCCKNGSFPAGWRKKTITKQDE